MTKPSERIYEILKSIPFWKVTQPDSTVDAILQYLDEQAELHKEDIRITQGR